jgi:hypothetical protein
LKTQGFSISTYAPIHSYSPFRDSLKLLVSTGGKYTVCLSQVALAKALVASSNIFDLFKVSLE